MNQALPQRLRGLEKNRLEALIDGIFAVALTLLVLDIRLPDNIVVASNEDLWTRLLGLERHFVIYVISFVVIGMYWINHHIQFHFVSRTNRAADLDQPRLSAARQLPAVRDGPDRRSQGP